MSEPNYALRRTVVALAGVGILTLGAGTVAGLTSNNESTAVAASESAPAPEAVVESAQPAAEERQPSAPVSMSATGDIILGDARGRLPINDGDGFFAGVADGLSADLVMGNMDAALTDDTGWDKCGGDTSSCYAFRSPPAYVRHLTAGGFDLINGANNHGYDYGPQGVANTEATLASAGIEYTGRIDEIDTFDINGTTVAVVGFSPYFVLHNSVADIPKGVELVSRAAEQADIVVVQAHMGAEGTDKVRVAPGTEIYFGENRGDVVAFSQAMIDAGADLIVGHGPHVLRGMEFYNGRLIAYSLGNFAGGGRTLQSTGPLGLGGILKVTLNPDGTWVSGQFIGTYMDGDGWPQIDYQGQALEQVRWLSQADFGPAAPSFAPDGAMSPPASTG